MKSKSFQHHLSSAEDLVTSYSATRAGFVAMALEKGRKSTPVVEEAKALKSMVSKCRTPREILEVKDITDSLLTAAGISDKAAKHLGKKDKTDAINGLIDNFLDPSGEDFVDELIYRFLLIRGDSLGGKMRNIAGILGERKFIRTLISTLSIKNWDYSWLHSRSKKWLQKTGEDENIEMGMSGIHWFNGAGPRTLIHNIKVPAVDKNVDLCLLNAKVEDFNYTLNSCHHSPERYIALGELKCGIDPAGADEHWKTAKSALNRIRVAFREKKLKPDIFFVGAAIERGMSREIYDDLQNNELGNAANLNDDVQLASLCDWLTDL